MRNNLNATSSWFLQNFPFSPARSRREHGHEVHFICPRDGYERALQAASFANHHKPLQADGTKALKELRTARRLRHLLAEPEPAFAYPCKHEGNIYTGLARRGLHAPFSPTVSGLRRTFSQPSRPTPLSRVSPAWRSNAPKASCSRTN